MYDQCVSGTDPVSDARVARIVYVAATNDLRVAMSRVRELKVSLDPPPGRFELTPWTEEQWRAMRNTARLWQRVVTTREALDAATQQPPASP